MLIAQVREAKRTALVWSRLRKRALRGGEEERHTGALKRRGAGNLGLEGLRGDERFERPLGASRGDENPDLGEDHSRGQAEGQQRVAE